ncbi:MAG: glycine cleavage system aminomethyltransferase GcvT, partial [Bifidobacteriaceae bacterium]|nr:glycine cleavage system aminomethyltransferase GcvT [Bifidobacteriaceae bacterium]
MADELFLSPLDQVHRAAGAQFTEFGGWKLPLRFTSELAEHHAVRQTAGLFDLSHMAQFEVSGPAAGSGLDYALLGKHSDMPLGRASYSMLLSEDGGVIDDLIVYRLGPEEFFVISNASNRAAVSEGLGRRLEQIDPATHFQDVTRDRALIAVQGPASPAIMAAAGFPQASELGYYRAAKAEWRGYPVVLARTGYTGDTGFEVSIAGQVGPELWEALIEAGRPHGLTLAGLAARDTLRLEAGMPLYGHELDLQTTPIEGGQGGFVRSKEADFVGKRALGERPVTKHLVG